MPTLLRVTSDNLAAYGPAYIDLRCQIDRETNFMSAEPGEREISIHDVERFVRRKRSALFLAEVDGRVVGFGAAIGNEMRRASKSVLLLAGILLECTDAGIAQALFPELEAWARSQGIHRLELTVTANNARGLYLYSKVGFIREGVKRESLYIDGAWVDEVIMAKLLD